MFSVGLLYSVRDFLKLSNESGMSPEEFQNYFRTFKYSTADKILDVSFKCGWSKLTQTGQIEVSERGKEIASSDYRNALLSQLEDMILNFNPVWASILMKGRSEARTFLPEDATQCFRECGLFDDLSDEIISFWDRLSLAYRGFSQKRMTEIGRIGEKLSYDYEKERTGIKPIWQALESNLAGFDILSVADTVNKQKLQIEVKATTANVDYAKIHITRNEWETAVNSLNYLFHIWLLKSQPKLITATVYQMEEHISSNKGHGQWESVEIPISILI